MRARHDHRRCTLRFNKEYMASIVGEKATSFIFPYYNGGTRGLILGHHWNIIVNTYIREATQRGCALSIQNEEKIYHPEDEIIYFETNVDHPDH